MSISPRVHFWSYGYLKAISLQIPNILACFDLTFFGQKVENFKISKMLANQRKSLPGRRAASRQLGWAGPLGSPLERPGMSLHKL